MRYVQVDPRTTWIYMWAHTDHRVKPKADHFSQVTKIELACEYILSWILLVRMVWVELLIEHEVEKKKRNWCSSLLYANTSDDKTRFYPIYSHDGIDRLSRLPVTGAPTQHRSRWVSSIVSGNIREQTVFIGDACYDNRGGTFDQKRFGKDKLGLLRPKSAGFRYLIRNVFVEHQGHGKCYVFIGQSFSLYSLYTSVPCLEILMGRPSGNIGEPSMVS